MFFFSCSLPLCFFFIKLWSVMLNFSLPALHTPQDSVKQRLQFAALPYRGMLDCAATTFRLHGLRGFFAGYSTALAMNVRTAARCLWRLF